LKGLVPSWGPPPTRGHTCVPKVRFDPMIPVLEWTQSFRSLDGMVIVACKALWVLCKYIHCHVYRFEICCPMR
jgi:hypothetical protein